MQLVMLAGELGEKYGTQHEYYNLRTPADAIKLLCINHPGFQRDLATAHENGIGYKLIQSGAAMGYDELHLPFGSKPMMLVPVISGSGGSTGQILIGVGLVAASFLLPGAGLFGATSVFGVSALTTAAGTATLATTIGTALSAVGASLILVGVANMISPQPEVPKLSSNRFDGGTNTRGTGPQGVSRGADGQQSYGFTGPANTVGTGATVPVIYGEVITGGHLLAVNLEVTDESDRLAKAITRPDVSETTINSERITRDLKSAGGLKVKRLPSRFDIKTNDRDKKIRIDQGFGPGENKSLSVGKIITTGSGTDLRYNKGDNKREKVDVILKLENGLSDNVSGPDSTKIPGFITYEVRLILRRSGADALSATARTTVQGLFNPNQSLVYGQRLELPKVKNSSVKGITVEVEIIDAEAIDRTTFAVVGYGYDLL
mgnify:CR=1 FL=1